MHVRPRSAFRPLLLALLVVLAASSAGCVANMAEFKDLVGQGRKAVDPVARASSNRTDVLVGEPVRFAATGSADPLGRPLALAWSFGDGATGVGDAVTHRYLRAGTFVATLEATNPDGRIARDAVEVRVAPGNRAPVAGTLLAPDRVVAGEPATFEAVGFTDPDRDALSYRWSFGAGDRTALLVDATVTHTFAKPGLHLVEVAAFDPALRNATAQRVVPVDLVATFPGEARLAEAAPTHAAPFAPGATALVARLAFDANLGLHNLSLSVKDGTGAPVAVARAAVAPGDQGPVEVTLALEAAALASAAPGEWTFTVDRASGLAVPYTLRLEARYGVLPAGLM
ncbi:MAG TPA: PKD domain-containing protein [Candidatus Thermoplasmatota archaeon]|nr:PKD domain-containing protein [Candidatus Thermoplasmatota archaeon]